MSGKGECLEVVPVEIINYFRVRDFELAVADGAEIDHLPASLKIDLPTTKQVSSSREFSGKWVLEVNVIQWCGPHTPYSEWRIFRSWKNEPKPERVKQAQLTAIKNRSLFGKWGMCNEWNSAGHMCDRKTCQSCAEQHLGVIH